jgi:hypothetical protein
MTAADNPKPRTIGLVPVQPQEMLRRALLLRLDLRASPIWHCRSPSHPQPIAIAGAGSRILGTNRG